MQPLLPTYSACAIFSILLPIYFITDEKISGEELMAMEKKN